MKISVVINTLNEESTIERAITSVKWADEILVCDMRSDDNTAVVAKRLGARVIFHKRLDFVEPARNFAVSKAEHPWVLILDPDEEVSEGLARKLKEIAQADGVISYVEVPRKNIVFGSWIRSANWWPDYNIRFFRQGSVEWSGKIHIQPKTSGQGLRLPVEEGLAIVHHHYSSVSQFIERMNRYTTVQAREMAASDYKFEWADLIHRPLGEFLGRFFANKGYEDGLHGFALCFLQALSFLVTYLKVWEMKGFEEKNVGFDELKKEGKLAGEELSYWLKYGNLSKNPLKAFLQRARNKLSG